MENNENEPPIKKPRKSKLKEWEDEDIFKLISLVEGESCIWNAIVDGYHNKTMRDIAWQNISDHFDGKYGTGDLNTKWTNLRIQFRSYAARAKTKSGQGTVEPIKWKYFNAISFVGRAEDRQTQQTTSNLVLETELGSSSTDFSGTTTTTLPLLSPQPAATSTPRRSKCETTQSAATQIAETMREAVAAMKERNNNAFEPNISFANFLVSELRTVSEDVAAVVRKKVTTYFLQCLEEHSIEI